MRQIPKILALRRPKKEMSSWRAAHASCSSKNLPQKQKYGPGTVAEAWVIQVPGRKKEEDQELKASVGIRRPCLKN